MTREDIADFMQRNVTSKLGSFEGNSWNEVFNSRHISSVRDFSQYWLQTRDDLQRYERRIPNINLISAEYTFANIISKLEKKEKLIARIPQGLLFPEFIQAACKRTFRTPESLINNYKAVQDCNLELYLRYESTLERDHKLREVKAVHHVLREYVKALRPIVDDFYTMIEQ